jgi:hypothetical protein
VVRLEALDPSKHEMIVEKLLEDCVQDEDWDQVNVEDKSFVAAATDVLDIHHCVWDVAPCPILYDHWVEDDDPSPCLGQQSDLAHVLDMCGATFATGLHWVGRGPPVGGLGEDSFEMEEVESEHGCCAKGVILT